MVIETWQISPRCLLLIFSIVWTLSAKELKIVNTEGHSGLIFTEQDLYRIIYPVTAAKLENKCYFIIVWPVNTEFHESIRLLCSTLNTRQKIASDTEQVQNNTFRKIFCNKWINKHVSTRLELKAKLCNNWTSRVTLAHP